MSIWVVLGGMLCGAGIAVAISELIPAGSQLTAALARLDPAGQQRAAGWGWSLHHGTDKAGLVPGFGRRLAELCPWLPVPSADLALLDMDRGGWLAAKVGCGLLGLAAPSALAALAALTGSAPPAAFPIAAGLALGAAGFLLPDLVVRTRAARRRADFRHAITSYLDLVGLERGAGAGPTESLEAAAEIGGGWAFERIRMTLDGARRVGAPPWTALARLAAQTGIRELADLADIAEVAGQEGARILDTLAARAASMRAEALAADRARAGSRSTTMVVPIALLGAGFLVLLIFPVLYRTFGAI